MKATEIEQVFETAIRRNSGLDRFRTYVGISQIGNCPCAIALDMRDGVREDTIAHHMSFTGYMHQRALVDALSEMGRVIAVDVEVYSTISPLFRGHADVLIQSLDGKSHALLDIKTTNTKGFENVVKARQAKPAHVDQLMLYMHYMKVAEGFLVYAERDMLRLCAVPVQVSLKRVQQLEEKAADILACLEAERLPACTCGRCAKRIGGQNGKA